jgi:hypothetical protein
MAATVGSMATNSVGCARWAGGIGVDTARCIGENCGDSTRAR